MRIINRGDAGLLKERLKSLQKTELDFVHDFSELLKKYKLDLNKFEVYDSNGKSLGMNYAISGETKDHMAMYFEIGDLYACWLEHEAEKLVEGSN